MPTGESPASRGLVRIALSLSHLLGIWLVRGGLALAGLSVVHLAVLLVLESQTGRVSALVGGLSHLLIPGMFAAGLLLAFVGWLQRRLLDRGPLSLKMRLRRARIEIQLPPSRRAIVLVLAGGLVSVFTLGATTYRGLAFVESTQFCAGVCHSQMRPEGIAKRDSPHSALECTACHVGPRIDDLARSKWNGLGEAAALALDRYPRPIIPDKGLMPAPEATCEGCHSPRKYYGDQIILRPHFASDEQNSDRSVAVLVKTGGTSARTGLSEGSHWHADPRNRVRYAFSDSDKDAIVWVEVTDADGKVREFVSLEQSISPEKLARAEKRPMDCLDCHNRQGHAFLTADQAIDQAIAEGGIARELPYIRKLALDLVSRPYASSDEARQAIAEGIADFYRARYPSLLVANAEAVRRSATTAAQLWTRHVFPDMNITWGTYPDHIGHRDSPGCFRCHDEKHESQDGKRISAECSDCHVPPVPKPINANDLATGLPAATGQSAADGAASR